MERRTSDSQKRKSQVKLPAIQHKKGESSRILSSTMPDNSRARPSSLYKVQDLQKKLFEKLDSYETVSRKNIRKGTKVKKGQNENLGQKQLQGYERLQKLMPGLYSKLLENKKGALIDQKHVSQPVIFTTEPNIQKLNDPTQQKQYLQKQIEIKEEQIDPEGMMSLEEMEEIYKQYSRREELPRETSGEQLTAMGQNLTVCQKQIAELTRSMESLIRQIGMECLSAFENEQQ